VLKTLIFSLQVGFTGNFVPVSLKTVFLVVEVLTPLFGLPVLDF